MRFSRQWAMPSPWTFSIPPITELLKRYIPQGENAPGPLRVIDPFAGRARWGTLRNDLENGKDAREWMRDFVDIYSDSADVVLLDPPYSPRQISESYKRVGLKVSSTDTQNAVLYKEAKDLLNKLLRRGGIAISCGWNSSGFGVSRKYELVEILLVAHGAAHNDTIVTVELKEGVPF